MWREVALRLQVVPTDRERVARVDVPIQLGDQLVVVGVVDISLIGAGVVIVSLDHTGADGIHDHLAHHPIASRDLYGQTSQRHHRVHEVRISLRPNP